MSRTGSTRALGSALLLLLLPGVPSCSACPPEAAERSAHPDYSTPSSTGLSFFAALGCDDARAEYGALGESLKRRHGATFDAWILARPALREELGSAVRHAHRLQPAREEVLESGVLVWWTAAGAERIGLLFQSEHFLELILADGREVGFHLTKPPGDWMQLEGKKLLLSLAVEDPVLRGVDPAQVQRITLATEWKIADWTMPE
jgi:hypothetical protein